MAELSARVNLDLDARAAQATAKGPRQPDTDKQPPSTQQAIRSDTAGGHLGVRLKKLKAASNLPWKTIAAESGVSRRWLLDIQSGRTPSAETRKAIRDYFARELKRSVRF